MSTTRTERRLRDLAALFPVQTHALNRADHELILLARDAFTKDMLSGEIINALPEGRVSDEAERLANEAAEAVTDMARTRPQTWDGYLARQVAFAAFLADGSPDPDPGGLACDLAGWAGSFDAVRLAMNGLQPPEAVQAMSRDERDAVDALRDKEQLLTDATRLNEALVLLTEGTGCGDGRIEYQSDRNPALLAWLTQALQVRLDALRQIEGVTL